MVCSFYCDDMSQSERIPVCCCDMFCVVSVEIRNWKPIPIDSVTDDLSATVQQIIGSLASLITIRIRITRCHNFLQLLSRQDGVLL